MHITNRSVSWKFANFHYGDFHDNYHCTVPVSYNFFSYLLSFHNYNNEMEKVMHLPPSSILTVENFYERRLQ
jgi:hypothetical protein